MDSSPIKYTSRTFLTIMNDFNANESLADKPEWFKAMVAGVGDMLSMINNAAANNAFLRTAFTRQAVIDLCALIGYEVPPAATSLGTVLFYFAHGATFPISLSATELVSTTRGTVAVASRRFEARSSYSFNTVTSVTDLSANPISGNAIVTARDFLTGEKVRVSCSGTMPTGLSTSSDYYAIRVDSTHLKLAASASDAFAGIVASVSGGSGNLTLTLLSGRVTCYQQNTRAEYAAGASDGITAWQEFDLKDKDVLRDTLSVKVNGIAWTRVDTLALSQPYDKHYQHVFKSDGSSYLRFGDGTYGAIPANFDVRTSYAYGGGDASNVSSLNSVAFYAGSSPYVVGCANATAMIGGSDAQSSEVAKRVAPGTLSSRDRFITSADGEALAVGYGGLSQARVIANAYGVLSCQVVGVAVGGGNPTGTYLSALQAYLISKTIMESIDVRAVAATITAHGVTASIRVLSGYLWTDVEPYARLAWKLFFSESGQEVIDDWLSNGISSATELCNSLFSESFTSDDWTAVDSLISLLNDEKYGARRFGDTIYESDALAFVQNGVIGIDAITLTAPTFPIAHDPDEISSIGSISQSEAT